MSEHRDYSPLFTIEGRCRICNELRTIAGRDVHSEYHLARGEALNEVRYLKSGRVERVIPMPRTPGGPAGGRLSTPKPWSSKASAPIKSGEQAAIAPLSGALPGARRLDPILQRIVRRELKRRKIAP